VLLHTVAIPCIQICTVFYGFVREVRFQREIAAENVSIGCWVDFLNNAVFYGVLTDGGYLSEPTPNEARKPYWSTVDAKIARGCDSKGAREHRKDHSSTQHRTHNTDEDAPEERRARSVAEYSSYTEPDDHRTTQRHSPKQRVRERLIVASIMAHSDHHHPSSLIPSRLRQPRRASVIGVVSGLATTERLFSLRLRLRARHRVSLGRTRRWRRGR